VRWRCDVTPLIHRILPMTGQELQLENVKWPTLVLPSSLYQVVQNSPFSGKKCESPCRAHISNLHRPHLVPLQHLTKWGQTQTQSILEMFMVCGVLGCADVRLVDPVDAPLSLTPIACTKAFGTGNYIVSPHLHVGCPG
jgi:hypothetical protein